MNEKQRKQLIDSSWQLHDIVENAYLQHPAKQGDPQWLEKQRLLLADMALHLLQTTSHAGEMNLEKLTNNLYAILTISDQFIDEVDLKHTADSLFIAKT